VKVFVDTNVWLSARFRPGLCADLLDLLVEDGIQILLDERVLGEFKRIARDKFKLDEATVTLAERFFHQYTCILPAANQPAEGIPDPDDAWIISAALAAGADLFITGDQLLLDLKQVDFMPILNPRSAYIRLRGLD
jgi:putative PIN family toxin of toxin-antitoxin system